MKKSYLKTLFFLIVGLIVIYCTRAGPVDKIEPVPETVESIETDKMKTNTKKDTLYKTYYKIKNSTANKYRVHIRSKIDSLENPDKKIKAPPLLRFDMDPGDEIVFFTLESPFKGSLDHPIFEPDMVITRFAENPPKGSYAAESLHRIEHDEYTVTYSWTVSFKSTEAWKRAQEQDKK